LSLFSPSASSAAAMFSRVMERSIA
jgi:hypothetical protein